MSFLCVRPAPRAPRALQGEPKSPWLLPAFPACFTTASYPFHQQHPILVSLGISHTHAPSTPLFMPPPLPGVPFICLCLLVLDDTSSHLCLQKPPLASPPGPQDFRVLCTHLCHCAPHPCSPAPFPSIPAAVGPSERPVSPTRLGPPEEGTAWVHPCRLHATCFGLGTQMLSE